MSDDGLTCAKCGQKINSENTALHERRKHLHTEKRHILVRKSPWVERAEHNELPAKEMTNGNG